MQTVLQHIMYRKWKQFLYMLIFCSLFSACSGHQKEKNENGSDVSSESNDNVQLNNESIPTAYPDTILESFIDSTNFGKRKRTKIILNKIRTDDSTFVHIQLFQKSKAEWELMDSILLQCAEVPMLNTEITDFNNDHYKDLLFTSGAGPRGGNIIQTLILFEPRSSILTWIKNSEDYPNLKYNPELNCIDACILTGGVTTFFLRLEHDSLIEFASVDQRDRVIVETIDKHGNRKEIKNIENKGFSDMARFINYNPLKEREEW